MEKEDSRSMRRRAIERYPMTSENMSQALAMRKIYIEICEEQRTIDIEKACGLLHELLTHFFRRGTSLEELKHNEEVFRKLMMKDEND